jgi:hypothetical protein
MAKFRPESFVSSRLWRYLRSTNAGACRRPRRATPSCRAIGARTVVPRSPLHSLILVDVGLAECRAHLRGGLTDGRTRLGRPRRALGVRRLPDAPGCAVLLAAIQDQASATSAMKGPPHVLFQGVRSEQRQTRSNLQDNPAGWECPRD